MSVFSCVPLSEAVIQQMGSVANGIGLCIKRKRSEEELDACQHHYRSVMENLNEVVFQVNEFGHWTSLNSAWTEFTGFELKETLGNLFLEFVHHDDRQRNSLIFVQLIERKLDYCRYETRFLTKDGKVMGVVKLAKIERRNEGEKGQPGTVQRVDYYALSSTSPTTVYQIFEYDYGDLMKTPEQLAAPKPIAQPSPTK